MLRQPEGGNIEVCTWTAEVVRSLTHIDEAARNVAEHSKSW